MQQLDAKKPFRVGQPAGVLDSADDGDLQSGDWAHRTREEVVGGGGGGGEDLDLTEGEELAERAFAHIS